MKNKDFLFGMKHSLISCFGVVLSCHLFIRLLLFISPTNFICNVCAKITINSFVIPIFIELCYIIFEIATGKKCEQDKGLGAFVGILIYLALTVIFFSLI